MQHQKTIEGKISIQHFRQGNFPQGISQLNRCQQLSTGFPSTVFESILVCSIQEVVHPWFDRIVLPRLESEGSSIPGQKVLPWIEPKSISLQLPLRSIHSFYSLGQAALLTTEQVPNFEQVCWPLPKLFSHLKIGEKVVTTQHRFKDSFK